MRKAKTILMIAPEPFLEPRGTPICVYGRIIALTALGYRVDLLTYHLGKTVEVPGLTIYRIPRVPWIKEVKIGASWTKVVLDSMLLGKAFAMLATGQYDVVHSDEEAAYFSVFLATLFGIPHVYDMHSSLPGLLAKTDGWNRWPVLALARAFERWTIRGSAAVIVASERLARHVRRMRADADVQIINCLPPRLGEVGYVQQAVARVRRDFRADGRVPIVYTGTLEAYQGIDLLIDSASLVAEDSPEAMFVIVGGTQDQIEYWEREVEERSLTDCVHLAGSVPLEDVGAYLDMAEILVSPRGAETPIASKVYAYLQAGKPIVATSFECHTQLLSGDSAVLVDRTARAFAEAVLSLIRDPDLRERLGRKAKKCFQQSYDSEVLAARLGRVYERLWR